MGKTTGMNKKQGGSKPSVENGKQVKPSSKEFDKDTEVFDTMSQELKEEGKKLFHKLDHEGAMLKYEKAVKLLPKYYIDVAYLLIFRFFRSQLPDRSSGALSLSLPVSVKDKDRSKEENHKLLNGNSGDPADRRPRTQVNGKILEDVNNVHAESTMNGGV